MESGEQDAEIRLLRERVHDLSDVMQGYVGRLALLEFNMTRLREDLARETTEARDYVDREVLTLTGQAKDFITRLEFTPVQRIVYGMVCLILGSFLTAVAGMIFKVVTVR